MTAKPKSNLSNRFWTLAVVYSRPSAGAGVTYFGAFCETINLIIQNYPICCMFAFSNRWVSIRKFLEPPSLPGCTEKCASCTFYCASLYFPILLRQFQHSCRKVNFPSPCGIGIKWRGCNYLKYHLILPCPWPIHQGKFLIYTNQSCFGMHIVNVTRQPKDNRQIYWL